MGAAPKGQNRNRGSWYERRIARVMATGSDSYNQMLEAHKRRLLSDLRGTILEIGAGTGPNLRFYAPGIRWFGLDPNPAMFPYAQQEAQRLGMAVELYEGTSEQLPFSADSLDAVVSTTVLCSVQDPLRSVQEVLRVLKPGGRFVFIEHVAAPQGTGLRRIQGILRPVWRLLAGGCRTNQETWAIIERVGFSDVQLQHFRVQMPVLSPHIAGVAVK
jgi:ubiquinone/menaquinone biosynthesis C-methylase UbiE